MYRFDTVSGKLIDMRSLTEEGTYSTYAVLSDGERRNSILEFVRNCLSDVLIGEIEIESENFNNISYSYVIKEYYNEMETGTSVFVGCTVSGEIRVCSFKFGSIFCKDANGSVQLSKDTPFIPEERAIKTAVDFVKEQTSNVIIEDSVVLKLCASENQQYYQISMDTKKTMPL